MNVLVLYQSRRGHTRQAADAIAQAARDLNHTVTVKSIIEVRKSEVQAADVLFIGTWIQGFILFGVKPAGATLWVPALPSLESKPVGIFCTYAFNPRGGLKALGTMLESRGATILGQRAFQRNHPIEGAASFVMDVIQSVTLQPA